MKAASIAAILLVCALASAGCYSERWAQYHRERPYRQDTLAVMTKDDVMALARAKVSDDVIISQIKASRSYFQLSTQDIIDLANAGVSDKVISAMIKADEAAKQSGDEGGYAYYYPPYYGYSGYPYWGYPWYPWYPSLYLGFSFGRYHPFYGYRTFIPRYGFSGFRGSFGGGRTIGGHR